MRRGKSRWKSSGYNREAVSGDELWGTQAGVAEDQINPSFFFWVLEADDDFL